MSHVSKRIMEGIEKSDLDQDIKDFLKSLLIIELRNLADKKPRYSEDYDRIIKRFAGETE